jgi:perosamine synthetase
MFELRQFADEHSLHVIEDAAHALPASYQGQMIGSISEVTAFSFYATKTLSTGEGGMITTNDDTLAERMRRMRLHGIGRDAWKRYSGEGSWYYEVLDAGYKYNMTDIQAALGLVQLSKCQKMRDVREEIAFRYSNAFQDLEELRIPSVRTDRTSAWHLYPLRIEPDLLTIDRSQFIVELKKAGVATSVHFIPLHLHPYYQHTYGYRKGDFLNAEAEYSRYFSLPLFSGMMNEQIEKVITTVKSVVTDNKTRRAIPAPAGCPPGDAPL